jgi:phosphoribosyl 1,2-cyclic phosphodiesterase
VKRIVPFHHDPAHTDDELDLLMAQAMDEAKPGYRVTPGLEGAVLEA